jgi:uncharacterized membrane protein
VITEIDVEVPVRTVYNQWTQFEDFPLFMDHVSEVQQEDDRHVRFRANIVGVSREWEAEITEQTPDQRVAWTSVDGTENSGVVTFHPLNDNETRVVLQLEMDPHGILEHVADKGGFVSDRAKKDLRDFKSFIEQRGHETGEFRDTIRREPDHDARRARESYEEMSKDELYAIAQEREIDGRTSMTKPELIEALGRDDRSRH